MLNINIKFANLHVIFQKNMYHITYESMENIHLQFEKALTMFGKIFSNAY
jgi:hypothetical protein